MISKTLNEIDVYTKLMEVQKQVMGQLDQGEQQVFAMRMQKIMNNPKAMSFMLKAQSDPKMMQAFADVQQNGRGAIAKYDKDPEFQEFFKELEDILLG